jgi:hypothetical protein
MRYIPPEYEAQARRAAARTKPEDRPESITLLRPRDGHYSGNNQPRNKEQHNA